MKTPLMGWAPVLLVPVTLLFAGCPGELDNPEAFTDGGLSGGCNTETRILEPTCGTSACHDATDPAAGLDLVSANPGQRLVGVQASCSTGMAESECDCGPRELITADPNDIDNSYLLEKVVSESPACDDAMPLLLNALPQADINCLREWALELSEAAQ